MPQRSDGRTADLSFEGIPTGMPLRLLLKDDASVEGLFVTADSRVVKTTQESASRETPRDRIRTIRFPSLDRMRVRNRMRDLYHTIFPKPTAAHVRLKDGRNLKGLILRDMSAANLTREEQHDKQRTIKINSDGRIVTVSLGTIEFVEFLQ